MIVDNDDLSIWRLRTRFFSKMRSEISAEIPSLVSGAHRRKVGDLTNNIVPIS